MIHWLETLLDLERIRFGEGESVELRFDVAPAPWIMLIGAVVAAVIAWGLYRRDRRRAGRSSGLLGLCRFGAIMTALFICGRPALVSIHTQREPSMAALLLDGSASMNRADEPPAPGADSKADTVARWSAAHSAVFDPRRGLVALAGDAHRLSLWRFGRSLGRVTDDLRKTTGDGNPLPDSADGPDDDRTDLLGALSELLSRTMSDRLAGVVVISDGRQTQAGSAEAVIALARSRGVAISALAVGSPDPIPDLDLASVWSPRDVFVHDRVVVDYVVRTKGWNGDGETRVELMDESDGATLAAAPQTLGPSPAEFHGSLSFQLPRTGRFSLRLRVSPRADEENTENNARMFTVTAHDAEFGVLYVEGTPRFEYRYLKNLLLRESKIRSSTLLLGASPGFPQEGSVPIQRFPRSIEELRRYDVIILGDVDPRSDWLSPVQRRMIEDFVSIDAGGLVFLSGERNMPRALRHTSLEPLLPVEIDPAFYGTYEEPLTAPFRPRLTPEGRMTSFLRLLSESGTPGPDPIDLESLPGFYWYATVKGPKPGSAVLAVHPQARFGPTPVPLLALGRYGRGRTLYVGADEFWRWREYVGDAVYDAFWLHVLYQMASGKRLGTSQFWTLETDKNEYELGEEVTVRLRGPAAAAPSDEPGPAIEVRDDAGTLVARVSRGDSTGRVATTNDDEIKPGRPSTRPPGFVGRFIPPRPGNYALSTRLEAGRVAPVELACAIQVVATDPEHAVIEADHELLRRLANATGGRFVRFGDDLEAIVSNIPDRSVRTHVEVTESIWDSRLMLGLFAVLISTEWAARRWLGLA